MTTYILEASFCMAISLCLYFLLFSHTRHLHFNRAYLLFTLALSLAVPLVDIETPAATTYFDQQHFNMSDTGSFIERSSLNDLSAGNMSHVTQLEVGKMILWLLYLVGLVAMLYRYVANLLRIFSTIRESDCQDRGSHKIVFVDRLIVPYSFMHFVFVSKADKDKIDPAIWCHELAHVRQWHSLDVLLIESLLVLLYFHPMVWVYRYALKLNHEYAADETVMQSFPDFEKYANQLIRYTQSKENIMFECGFNYLSIKKRLKMLTKSKNSPMLFGSKIALASLAMLATASILSFTNVPKPQLSDDNNGEFTVVIDLGHGGKDVGATVTADGITEAAIINSIGAIIREIDSKTRFVYTRNNEYVSLKDRVAIATNKKADLMLSLHIGYSENEGLNGVEVFYSDSNFAPEKSQKVGEKLVDGLKFRTGSTSNRMKKADFMVLKNGQCPSVLLSLGFLSNEEDLAYLMDKDNQKNLAHQIVDILEELSQN